MTTTAKLIGQIDEFVTLVRSHSNAVDAEVRRYEKQVADYKADCQMKKQNALAAKDAATAKALADAEAEKIRIQGERSSVQMHERNLEQVYSRSRLYTKPQPSGDFDADDAIQTIRQIKEDTLWAWVKKLFGLFGYGLNSDMAATLYGKIDNAYRYLDSRERAADNEAGRKTREADQRAGREIRNLETLLSQNLNRAKSTHQANLKNLEQKALVLSRDPRIGVMENTLKRGIRQFGADGSGWQQYSQAGTVPGEMLLGKINYTCGINPMTSVARDILKHISFYKENTNGFAIPLTVDFSRSALMYMDCAGGNVADAAQVFRSVLLRQIRYMPPKSHKIIFIDPVNRGTAMNKLILLAGEGSGRLCEYCLTRQDINSRLEALTRYVDALCQKLTSAGRTDIHAYNAIRGIGRQKYTTLVIHDYPNGLDTQSLDYLEVLVNKARQCGISILISHKASDKIEHRAAEVLQSVRKNFNCFRVDERGNMTLVKKDGSYRFADVGVKVEDSWYDAINKLLTYKPPVESRFEKLFDLTNLPQPRNCFKGLNIPYAIAPDGKMVELELGYHRCVHGFVSGSIGSGKTSMLHMLIVSAAMHYSPEDLEMWLIDYKETSFEQYRSNCPPQVRYVVMDTANETSFSMIDELRAEYARRKKLLKAAGVEEYEDYRKKGLKMPRLLVIIDEFHKMSNSLTEDTEYRKHLDDIIREVRHAGISLLLCDQFSSGLKGLTDEGKKMISTRIAMKSVGGDIKETLAPEKGQLTEEVDRMITDLTSAAEGRLICKYQIPNKNNPGSNLVIFQPCRAVYVKPHIADAVQAVRRKWQSFSREKVIYDGARRRVMDTEEIDRFEKAYSGSRQEGDRLYIGSPAGVRPCFYLNLKTNLSGENILMVGSDQEKRLAMIQSMIRCARRSGYKVNVLAARASLLYKQNQEFFKGLKNVNLITAFPEICRYVGQKANAIRALYSEEDEDMNVPHEGKVLTIFVGLDESYAQMEASSLTQKAAWTVEEPGPKAPEVKPREPRWKPEIVSPKPGEAKPEGKSDSPLGSTLDDIDAFLTGFDEAMVQMVPESYAGGASTGIKGYNATQDLGLLISDGWKLGIHSMVVVDRGMSLNKMRQAKVEGNFNHRIALTMSPDEAQYVTSKTRVMKALADSQDTISAVYQYLGGREQCFRPYLLK